jgi:hypothetical protein
MSRSREELHDIAVTQIHETPKAVLFDTGEGKFWVPKSILGDDGIVQVEENKDGSLTLTAPVWWLNQRELI